MFDGENNTYSAWFTFTGEGIGWSSPRLIDDSLVCEGASSIAVDSQGSLHVVWDSGPTYVPPDEEIRGEIFYSALEELPDPITTAIITPEGGGTLYSPSGDVLVTFPPGAVVEDMKISFTETSFMPTFNLAGILFFELSAETVSDGSPVTTFTSPYSITINYGVEGAGPAFEETLSLYYWDGFQWWQIPSDLNTGTQTISAQLNHMTTFALLGETNHLYLPLAVK